MLCRGIYTKRITSRLLLLLDFRSLSRDSFWLSNFMHSSCTAFRSFSKDSDCSLTCLSSDSRFFMQLVNLTNWKINWFKHNKIFTTSKATLPGFRMWKWVLCWRRADPRGLKRGPRWLQETVSPDVIGFWGCYCVFPAQSLLDSNSDIGPKVRFFPIPMLNQSH